jgi:signal transduction histidine kinase
VRAQAERARLLEEAQELSREAAARRTELERAMASKARLIRGFAHDIKNPLGAANGRAELLLEGVVGEIDDATREQLEGICRSVNTALELVTTLVEFTRVEAGQIELERTPTELARIARQVAEDYTAAAAQRGVDLRVDECAPLSVTTDAARVRQILDNLVSNAVKYTSEGSITIVVEPPAEHERAELSACAAVRVRDTGRGVPADRVQELFLEFSRIDPVDKSGAGLGLAISRRLARLLGGDILVETEEGRGSTFSLLLS